MTNLEKLQKQQSLLEGMFRSLVEVMSDVLNENRRILDGLADDPVEAPVPTPVVDADPITEGLNFNYDGMLLCVVGVYGDDILCQSVVTVVRDGFESQRMMDVRLKREVVLKHIPPYLGQEFIFDEKLIKIQLIEDDKVYGTEDGVAPFVMDYNDVVLSIRG